MNKYLETLTTTISNASQQILLSKQLAKGSFVADQIDQSRLKLPSFSSEFEVLAAFANLITKNTGNDSFSTSSDIPEKVVLGVRSTDDRHYPLVVERTEATSWPALCESVQRLFDETTESLRETTFESVWNQVCSTIDPEATELPFRYVFIFERCSPSSM